MNTNRYLRYVFLALTLAVTQCVQPTYAAAETEIRVVSSRPDTVSGGTVLVALKPASVLGREIYLNGHDVTEEFRWSHRSGEALALLSGLRIGENALEVRAAGGVHTKTIITNHPISGPIFSGPHQQPFVCQTEANGLGPATDADC